MSLTIFTRHPAASRLDLDIDKAKIEIDPGTGMVNVIDPDTGAFLAKVSAVDFAAMVTDKVKVTPTVSA